MEEVYLEEAKFKFNQECNTNGSTGKGDDSEEIEITMESACGPLDKDGGFYVIRTNGWSINSPQDLLDLFEKIKNIKY